LLTLQAEAARRYVERATRRKLVTDDDPALHAWYARMVPQVVNGERVSPVMLDGDPLPMDADIKQAMLMLIAHWYENREAVQYSKVSYVTGLAVKELLNPHTVYGV
jgi:hypothetical protein